MEEQYPMESSANPMVQASQIRSRNMANDSASKLQRATPGILGAVGGVGASMALNHALPNLLKGSTQETLEKNLQTPSQPPVAPNLTQQAAPIQPEIKPIDLKEVLNKYPGFESKVNELLKTKNPPESIAAYFKKFNPGQTAKLEKESGKPIEQIIAEYASSIPEEESKRLLSKEEALGAFRNKQMIKHAMEEAEKANVKPLDNEKEEMQAQEHPSLESESKELDVSKETPKIEKGSTVASPEGIGEVKEIRNGQAIVEVNGKLHKVNEDELEPPDFSEDEIADAYDDLMAKIPEAHRSGFISWAGYDEDRNVLGFIPRGGKYEELHDITPEEAQIIKEGKGIARTSGQTREGVWVIGEDTRGGLISQIIHDRKRKHKENAENQLMLPLELPKGEKQDKGMKSIFDEMQYARDLSRAREKKKRDEERAKKKQERDEAKKRKKSS